MFEKNLETLLRLNPKIAESVDEEVAAAQKIIEKYQSLPSENYDAWVDSDKHAIVLPNYMTRSEKDEQDWRRIVSKEQNNLEGDQWTIKDYLDYAAEIHLGDLILALRDCVKKAGFDPDINHSPLANGVNAILAFGTGDGKTLQEMVRRHKPDRLLIYVSSWSEFISSFHVCDWKSIWEEQSKSLASKPINITRIHHMEEPLDYVQRNLGLLFDHTYIYEANYNSELLTEATELIRSRRAVYNVLYMGYVIDEFNMIYNTARTLKASKAYLFRKPLKPVKGSAIVCGSGPSLDNVIPILKGLQETHTIIAGGSNYMTLLRHSIEVDYLVLVERAEETLRDYETTYKEFGMTNTTLVMSSTCPAGLLDLFKNTIVFFRPALTSSAVFTTSGSQILHQEGPESVNGAFAFACELGFSDIVLAGTDLGTADKDYDRSKDAVGVSERTWDIEYKGNLLPTVYTNALHADVRGVIERRMHQMFKEIKTSTVVNISNGVYIEGAEPCDPQSFIPPTPRVEKSVSKKAQLEWFNLLDKSTEESTMTLWNLREPRQTMGRISNQVRLLLDEEVPWFPTKVEKLQELLNPNDKPIRDQIPIRLSRNVTLKGVLMISQQLQIMRHSQDLSIMKQYIELAINVLKEMSFRIENEFYDLCDLIDSTN